MGQLRDLISCQGAQVILLKQLPPALALAPVSSDALVVMLVQKPQQPCVTPRSEHVTAAQHCIHKAARNIQ